MEHAVTSEMREAANNTAIAILAAAGTPPLRPTTSARPTAASTDSTPLA